MATCSYVCYVLAYSLSLMTSVDCWPFGEWFRYLFGSDLPLNNASYSIFTMLHKLILSNNSPIKQILLDQTVGIRWSVLTCISGFVEQKRTKSPPQYPLL